MSRLKFFVLPVILMGYALLYMATKKDTCFEDCQKIGQFIQTLQTNRSYVYGAFRCSQTAISDTLCVYADKTVAVNWNLLADTACMIATQKGLLRQIIIIIDNRSLPFDTLAQKQCP